MCIFGSRKFKEKGCLGAGARKQCDLRSISGVYRMKWGNFCWVVVVCGVLSVCFGEFQVNTYRSEDQKDAGIAMDGAGNFVVVWGSYRQDSSSGGIYGQRFSTAGDKTGEEFQVNTTTEGNQKTPAVAMNDGGDFVVVWQGPGVSEEDIFAQLFSAAGEPLGQELCVSGFTESRQLCPSVAMSDDGRFVVVWESERLGAKPYAKVIAARMYDSSGAAAGAEFVVSLLVDGRYPDVTCDGTGNFIVVWMQERSSNKILARIYNSNGSARTDPFEVSTEAFASVTRPSVAADMSGHFVVAWDASSESAATDDIYARCYKFDGSAKTEPFVVNTTSDGAQQYPTVAMNNRREFLIVWNSEIAADPDDRDIFAQRFDSLGAALGGEFRVNTYLTGDQRYAAGRLREDGGFAVVWQSFEQDGSLYGIFGDVWPKDACGDFTHDGSVNFRDYSVFAAEWGENGDSLQADLVDDDLVNGRDLAVFCSRWLGPAGECGDAAAGGAR